MAAGFELMTSRLRGGHLVSTAMADLIERWTFLVVIQQIHHNLVQSGWREVEMKE